MPADRQERHVEKKGAGMVSDIRATSHTRLRARDQYTSSTLIGGKAEPVQVRFSRDQRSM
jgi:hypothetical protein